jgi:hypothetical protein
MITVNFETEECNQCGIIFQVPEEFCENRQEDGSIFYCPNGHGQSYVVEADDNQTKDRQIENLESKNRDLQIQVRQLKCKLMRGFGWCDKLKMWWKGGLA